jgi:holo-[acyl-carrier protein] synthase
MSIVGHGIDLIECERIARVLERHGARFLDRVLTAAEQRRAGEYKDVVPFVAGRFAAKEAILKMLGTGWRGRIAWTDMEVLPDGLGQPMVSLSGETARIAAARGIDRVIISITHTAEYAAASAIGLSGGNSPAS